MLTGSYSNNYYINSTTNVSTILRKTVPIYFDVNNKNFDGLSNATIYNITISNIIFPDNIFIISYKSNFIDPNVGFNKLIIVSDISFGGLSIKLEDSYKTALEFVEKIKKEIDESSIEYIMSNPI